MHQLSHISRPGNDEDRCSRGKPGSRDACGDDERTEQQPDSVVTQRIEERLFRQHAHHHQHDCRPQRDIGVIDGGEDPEPYRNGKDREGDCHLLACE